ncbi:quercetin dioxygenase-like cupin family protein [Lipingzhangella halophila]|uniref:Quercetin dioxygenase-like cupin family protein n=1 Tax=Lipingzhangella halophila TaxID=1783352 RepID=A0A7W7W464_9ACTN|nr:LuxR family transcriptional regulator [Lipingzhangella halophila]MBB4932519.1 quercetin dioxygenase-like cupin family protein [Lipingzhangella halophila]
MRKFSLDALARNHLEQAANASSGRSSTTVFGGHEHTLRHTLIALTRGNSLSEHPNPGESTLVVVRGRVRLLAGEDSWEGRTGDMLIIPQGQHSLEAVEDAVVLLNVAMAGRATEPEAAS